MAVSKHSYEAVVVGVSAGGLAALVEVLPKFELNMMLPVMIVQHQSNDSDDFLVRYFDQLCRQSVREDEHSAGGIRHNLFCTGQLSSIGGTR